MFLATSNPSRQLLHLSFVAHVSAQDLSGRDEELGALLKELKPGFRLLSDLERMESMSQDCAPLVGKMMELFDRHGLELIVRIIPDPSRDIGLNILSIFHYPRRPRVVACANMLEAAEVLGLLK